MSKRFRPIGEGKHNNVYYRFTIKVNKQNLISITINCFPDTGNAYIMNSSYKVLEEFIDKTKVLENLSKKLSNEDFKLILLDKPFFNNTEELINYLKHEHKTI